MSLQIINKEQLLAMIMQAQFPMTVEQAENIVHMALVEPGVIEQMFAQLIASGTRLKD